MTDQAPAPLNLYAILGLNATATDAEIKAAYRRLAKLYHPDTADTADADMFAAVSRAYDTLKDPLKRATYDRTGDVEEGSHKLDAPAQKASRLIVRTMSKVLNSLDEHQLYQPKNFDVVAGMTAQLEIDISNLDALVTEMEEAIDSNQDLMKRFKLVRKGHHGLSDRTDPIRKSFESNIRGCRERIETANEEKEIAHLAIEMLKGYSFAYDAPLENDFFAEGDDDDEDDAPAQPRLPSDHWKNKSLAKPTT